MSAKVGKIMTAKMMRDYLETLRFKLRPLVVFIDAFMIWLAFLMICFTTSVKIFFFQLGLLEYYNFL